MQQCKKKRERKKKEQAPWVTNGGTLYIVTCSDSQWETPGWVFGEMPPTREWVQRHMCVQKRKRKK